MRSTCPAFARALIARCRAFQVSPPPGTGTIAVFTFPPGAVVAFVFSPKLAALIASSALAAIAQQHTTQTVKTNRPLQLLKQLLSRPNHPAPPKSTLLIGNCICGDFIPGDSAPAPAEGKDGFDFFRAARALNGPGWSQSRGVATHQRLLPRRVVGSGRAEDRNLFDPNDGSGGRR